MWNGLERPNASAHSPLPVASLTLQCTACYRMKTVERWSEATMSPMEECCRVRELLQSWVPGRYGMLGRERRWRWTSDVWCREWYILSTLVLIHCQVNYSSLNDAFLYSVFPLSTASMTRSVARHAVVQSRSRKATAVCAFYCTHNILFLFYPRKLWPRTELMGNITTNHLGILPSISFRSPLLQTWNSHAN